MPGPSSSAQRACVGVYAVFTASGIPLASFAARIADAKHALAMSPAQLGWVLFATSVGSVGALPFAGWVSSRIGAGRAVLAGVGLCTIGLMAVGLAVDVAHSRPLMACGLFLMGIAIGTGDVAMNLEGAMVERELGRSVMPRFHACFSGGTVIAALAGAPLSALRVPLTAHFAGAMAISAIGAVWGVRRFLSSPIDDPAVDGRPARLGLAWTEPRTLLLGLMMLAAAFSEGSAVDWIGVGFVDGHHVPPWAGVLAFATFLILMTTGRVVGTTLLDRFGRVPMLRTTFLLAGLGSLLVIFGDTPMAYAGAAVWGLGASLGFPVGMSAASDDPAHAAARISVVSTIGYTGFIAGPPLLGNLGNEVGVLRALLVVTAVTVIALFVVPVAREGKPS